MKKTDTKDSPKGPIGLTSMTPSQRITQQITELSGWRGSMLARLRKMIHEADPELTEEWKWETAVWSRSGNVVSIGVFKDHLKVNFFKGAALEDPHGLFNAGLESKGSRAIDLHEDDDIDKTALENLVRSAVAHNMSGSKK